MTEDLKNKAESYLKKLCIEIKDRSVGNKGNREATEFFQKEIASLGWNTETDKFDAIDWQNEGAKLLSENKQRYELFVSPYSLGCSVKAELVGVSMVKELEQLDANGKIILLHGEIAKEQLMPKNFVFYNPEEHQQKLQLL